MRVLLLFLMSITGVRAAVDFRWMGGSSVLLTDGTSTILFDPAYTRPTAGHWLGLSEFRSDEELVKKVLSLGGVTKLDALFVAHTHFDHVVDAPTVAALTGTKLFGDKGAGIIARASGKKIDFVLLTPGSPVKSGNFTVTPFQRSHSPLLNLFDFLPGEVAQDFDFGFYDYKGGTNWFFLVEHPEGRILIDNSQEAVSQWAKPSSIDVLIQGVTNSNEKIVYEGYVRELRPRLFIPIHFDRFMLKLDLEAKLAPHLPNINMESLRKLLSEKDPLLKFIVPAYREPIRVLP